MTSMLHPLLLALLLGTVGGTLDWLRVAWFHPGLVHGPVEVLGWLLVAMVTAVVLLGLPVALLGTVARAVPGLRRPPGATAIVLQLLAVAAAWVLAWWLGPGKRLVTRPDLSATDVAATAVALVGLWLAAALLGRLLPSRPPSRRELQLVLGAAVVLPVAAPLGVPWIGAPPPAREVAGPSPHVVMIVLDTVRADEFYAALEDPEIAPRLGALARESTLYRNLTATSTWTLPTHASLFTGLMPRVHGARVPSLHLEERYTTLAELLSRQGYETLSISTNPWLDEPYGVVQGFDRVWLPRQFVVDRPLLATFWDRWRFHLSALRWSYTKWGDKLSRYAAELAERWIDVRRDDPKRRMFVFLNFMNAHLPYLPPPPYPEQFLGKSGSVLERYRHHSGPLDPEQGRPHRKRADGLRLLYRASLAYLDEVVGEFVEGLRADGLLDDTLLVITSDHGEHIGDHGYLGHTGPPWRTTTWVPLLIRYPERFAAGAVDERLVSQVDFLPTVLDVLELPGGTEEAVPYELPGTSLLAPDPGREFVVTEFFGHEEFCDWAPQGSLHGTCIVAPEARLLLLDQAGYSLSVPTGEGSLEEVVTEHAQELEHPLRVQLEEWLAAQPAVETDELRELDPEVRERLRALGYLDHGRTPDEPPRDEEQDAEDDEEDDVLPRADGYGGIWYSNQPSEDEYRYKYSGGLATYPQQHVPIACYDETSNKTFFVYGGRDADGSLLHMVSWYDHETGTVPRPVILLDKETRDAHDNPTLAIDDRGHLWVFSNSHGTSRPSYLHRSREPRSIERFERVLTSNFSYGQPWFVPGRGFCFLHTRYEEGRRHLYAWTSKDGRHWEEPRPLARFGVGHYQISGRHGPKVATAFNYHPEGGGLNARSNLYYLESADGGRTWQTVDGRAVELPVTDVDHPCRVLETKSRGELVYLKDLPFDAQGRPIVLYLTSRHYASGPRGAPRIWHTARWTGEEWDLRPAVSSDHNYDFGSLVVAGERRWLLIAPTDPGPQPYGTGGEVVLWRSGDLGDSWNREQTLTHDSPYNHTYVRRPVPAHPGFQALWADGHAREPSSSRLYFTDRAGTAVWRLPETMNGELATPERLE